MSDKRKIIPMATDHGGYAMKEFLKKKLTEVGYEVVDFGTYSEESVDYPDFIHPLAKAVNDGEYERGIIMCGSGNGAQMTANKHQNVRAGLCWNEEQTRGLVCQQSVCERDGRERCHFVFGILCK